MPTLKITKTAVDALSASERTVFLWDTEERGFGVRVTAGGVRSYVYQYRMGGRETPARRHTIGKHGSPWTPETARREARRLSHLVETGVDPIDLLRDNRRRAVDLAFSAYAQLFHDRYLAERWKNAANTLARLKADAVPVLGRKALPDIRRSDIAQLWDRMADRPAAAKLMHSTLRKLFRWAVERGDLDKSPLDGTQAPPAVKSRDRVLSDKELSAAWLAASKLHDPFRAFFELLILTGQRRNEIAGLNWSELDRENAVWTIPAARAKNRCAHDVPLNAPALSIIDRLAGGPAWPSRGLAITTTGRTPISGFGKIKSRLDAEMLNLVENQGPDQGSSAVRASCNWRVHDLRRTLATGLQRLGVRFEVTEAVLNHVGGSKGGVAGVYQRHNWSVEKKAALQSWGRFVDELTAPRSLTKSCNVVELRVRQ